MNLPSPSSTPMGAFFLEYTCPFSSMRSLSKIAIPQNTCANRAGVQILSVKEIYGAFCEVVQVFCWAAEVAVVSCADVYLRAKVCQLREAKPQQSVVSAAGDGASRGGDTAKPGPCFLFLTQRAGSLWSEPRVSSVQCRQEQTWSHTCTGTALKNHV